MAQVSDNLALTLVDPTTDGDEAFNISTMLNFNWRKVDAAVGDLDVPALELGLESTDIAGILKELADRVIALEEGN
jgi:hypothetical protein